MKDAPMRWRLADPQRVAEHGFRGVMGQLPSRRRRRMGYSLHAGQVLRGGRHQRDGQADLARIDETIRNRRGPARGAGYQEAISTAKRRRFNPNEEELRWQSDFSFDVVSKLDANLIDECVQVAMRRYCNRFDYQGSISKDRVERQGHGADDHLRRRVQAQNVMDVAQYPHGQARSALEDFTPQKLENGLGSDGAPSGQGANGIPSDKAKEIAAAVKKSGLKSNLDTGRSAAGHGRSKDDLQSAMGLLKAGSFGIDLQFTNYR